MFRLAIAVSTLALMIPQVALAEWVPVSKSGNQMISVDNESLTYQGNIVSFWYRIDNEIPEEGLIETQTRMLLNCRNGLQQRSQVIGFNELGEQVINQKYRNTPPEKTIPGSTGEAVAQFVCQQ